MPNYTVNFVVKPEKPNPVGLIPIYLKITIERKTAYMATGHFIHESKWNPKTQTVRDAKTLNIDLEHRKNQVKQKIVELQVQGKTISSKIIKERLSGKDQTNIFNFIDAYIDEVKHKKDEQTTKVYQRESNTLEKYNGSRNLTFEEITKEYLKHFEKHLRDKGYANNYIFGIFKTIKVFFNAARKRKLTDNYPFSEYENPVYKQPVKQRLTIDELAAWEKYISEVKNPVWKEAAIYFLLGCYTGLRVSDWRAFNIEEHVNDGIIRIKPTKKSTGFVTMPISRPLQRTLERMKEVPLTIEEPTINEKLKYIAKAIGIDKRISTHSGRHTFAITICAEGGVSCEVCAKLMGITISTCEQNYYRVSSKKVHEETLRAWEKLQ